MSDPVESLPSIIELITPATRDILPDVIRAFMGTMTPAHAPEVMAVLVATMPDEALQEFRDHLQRFLPARA